MKDIKQQFREKFGEESGVYYGKDWDGKRIFIPKEALEDIEKFLEEYEASIKAEIRENFEGIKAMDRKMLSMDEVLKLLK